ncbi:MAG: HEAT repeat domain-containing protein [Chloroflexi bacterium]|nr:HEAT repeat domain-containing protein [Chloroflexota bacterium]
MGFIEELIEELVNADFDRSRRARQQLAALGRAAVDALTAALPAGTDQQRWKIIILLSEIGDPKAVPAFIDCLRSRSPAIQAAAAQFLGNAGDRRAVEPLLHYLFDDESACSLVWIVQALGKLRDRRAVEPLLRVVQTTDSASVRYTAIEALGNIGDPKVADIIRLYANDSSHHVRSRVVSALEQLHLSEARQVG